MIQDVLDVRLPVNGTRTVAPMGARTALLDRRIGCAGDGGGSR
jgi:hypothetical protein